MVKDFKINSKFYKVTLWVILWMIPSVQAKRYNSPLKIHKISFSFRMTSGKDALEYIQGNIDKNSWNGLHVDKFFFIQYRCTRYLQGCQKLLVVVSPPEILIELNLLQVEASSWAIRPFKWNPHRHIGNPEILRLLFLGLWPSLVLTTLLVREVNQNL